MNVLFVNHKQQQCGVYQYGLRTYNIVTKSAKHNFIYCEVDRPSELSDLLNMVSFGAVIYNYHNLTMAWLSKEHLRQGLKHLCIHHEGSVPRHIGFNAYLHIDSTFIERGSEFALPRPLFENNYCTIESFPHIPVVSSFGFGFGHKGFGSVVKLANEQFDEVIIRLHIPRAYYGDRNGEATAGVLPGSLAEMKNPKAKIEITHDFLSNKGLLKFLSQSDINVFLYHETHNTGLSSVIDYALSVPVPIAVNKTSMFRHIAKPEICVEDTTLPQIIANGSNVLDEYKQRWSNVNFILKYESILDRIL